MTTYEDQARAELEVWQQKMQKGASWSNRIAKSLQDKINRLIPEKVHKVITVTIEKMIKAAIFGIKYTTDITLPPDASLLLRESHIKRQVGIYQKTASVEGAITGAGGILMGFADFPILIGIKMKLLFNIASLYGYNVKDYKERLYLLYIFQLAYSSQQRRNEIYLLLQNWETYSGNLPENAEDFDWRIFQQEYRDYIDLAKMAQLLPVIGAAVGAIANYKLVAQLGDTAMNCFRMRKLSP
ncbi:EcsC family protein [Mucilaginibacter terrigena]|uniref:EcsC family protein n=1 Tax=Mucilaginibacter terrigena TaxID=2492395 RepID=A0A4Q5LRV6_9SPHI|nr:EcsC family protein [Mucilaginibacter terrigena]RYU92215.1 EcsC family protein [Mucilaginibacter terrigena]